MQRLEKVLDLCETLGVEGVWDRAEALAWLGLLEALNFGNLIKGLSLSKEGELIYRELGEAAEWDLITVLGGKTYIYLYLNNLDEAQSYAEEGWELARDMDGFTISEKPHGPGRYRFPPRRIFPGA